MIQKFDVVIIGGGAAGLMCAIEAGKRGRTVCIIDHAKSLGKKIRISGGGRCNFTNLNITPENYLSQNSNFCVSALKRYTAQDFIYLVEKYQIKYHEKTLGQLFCNSSSALIIDMLLNECKRANVFHSLETLVLKVTRLNVETNEQFSIETNKGIFHADSLVIATGGISIPQMGATGFGYELAKNFGLKIIPPRPALVPLTLQEEVLKELRSLAGLSVEAKITTGMNNPVFLEGMLITHKGLSGPAILQISSYWEKGEKITINLIPSIDLNQKLREAKKNFSKTELQTIINEFIPKRLTQFILEQYKLIGKKLSDLSHKQIDEIASMFHSWQLVPNGTEGFKKAEVTLGGVDTAELSSKTLEAKKVPGLYFIGEVVDVTGHLGGYNFQWAWSSGFVAGQYA